ncbi:TIGR04219 family outer membrane beta-barrel protein [Litorilituus lipolyticus]|uniref:TIGR04219 family outer membrane beta-barrel protein n=1 Tax=Litorilituus lipolyticus TaxID=2491017 RepID=A0A502KZZ3_9GAMM|nr:TIGR04219 family outer membrane beta-barrel protein [Litorilituus lipolyticus]TPH16109.1 TIGR04219 family outer membrane beta-barrel protein [Litorilituus lipolyticus]
MKKTMLAASLALMTCATAQADTLLGLYIGGQAWANQTSGSFGEGEIDQAVFNFDDEYQGSYFIAFEHPIPLIPNAKIARTSLDTVGGTQLTSTFEFNGEVYSANTTLDTTLDTSYIDYTLYYELFDNDLLTFDFGLTAREIDTYIKVEDSITSLNSDLSASGYIPMLYLSTIVGLPFTGFNFFAEGNFVSYDDNTVYDVQAGVSYELLDNLAVDLDLTVGYRSVKLELNDLDDFYSDMTFDGLFVGAIVHF